MVSDCFGDENYAPPRRPLASEIKPMKKSHKICITFALLVIFSLLFKGCGALIEKSNEEQAASEAQKAAEEAAWAAQDPRECVHDSAFVPMTKE